ncbi:Exodeoxyribonuclease V beta chain [Providencia stuartii]|nr:Exodeoxyribonuclease V beta chain [Providencia stuartii]
MSYSSGHSGSGNEQAISAEQLATSLAPKIDVEASLDATLPEIDEFTLTPHLFPRGTAPGTFLHELMEEMDFSQEIPLEWLVEKLQGAGFDTKWADMLQAWLAAIVDAPLADDGLCLSALAPQDMLDELQFYLPIDNLLQAEDVDRITHRYDPLSAACPPLNFEKVQGILKGFIDLTFLWKGKFYLLDYKSNYLGDDAASYTQSAMAEAMIDHRYDLQYQLYSLALHRYLKQRLPNYQYDVHFGWRLLPLSSWH